MSVFILLMQIDILDTLETERLEVLFVNFLLYFVCPY
jgi:hypothetical protein